MRLRIFFFICYMFSYSFAQAYSLYSYWNTNYWKSLIDLSTQPMWSLSQINTINSLKSLWNPTINNYIYKINNGDVPWSIWYLNAYNWIKDELKYLDWKWKLRESRNTYQAFKGAASWLNPGASAQYNLLRWFETQKAYMQQSNAQIQKQLNSQLFAIMNNVYNFSNSNSSNIGTYSNHYNQILRNNNIQNNIPSNSNTEEYCNHHPYSFDYNNSYNADSFTIMRLSNFEYKTNEWIWFTIIAKSEDWKVAWNYNKKVNIEVMEKVNWNWTYANKNDYLLDWKQYWFSSSDKWYYTFCKLIVFYKKWEFRLKITEYNDMNVNWIIDFNVWWIPTKTNNNTYLNWDSMTTWEKIDYIMKDFWLVKNSSWNLELKDNDVIKVPSENEVELFEKQQSSIKDDSYHVWENDLSNDIITWHNNEQNWIWIYLIWEWANLIINYVIKDSPADKAWVKKGDILIELWWKQIANMESYDEMARLIKEYSSWNTNWIALKVKRDDSYKLFNIIPELINFNNYNKDAQIEEKIDYLINDYLKRKCSIENSKYDNEQTQAYKYLCEKWLIDWTPINDQDLLIRINRYEAAEILSKYAIEVMWKTLNENNECNFDDYKIEYSTYNKSVENACKLWIMWVWIKTFNWRWILTRAEFWTILSRMLRGDKYNMPWDNWRTNHLNALKNSWIITNTDPNIIELKWWVYLMLYRNKEFFEAN